MEYGLIFQLCVSGVISVENGQIFQVTRIGKYYCKNMKYRINIVYYTSKSGICNS